MAEKSHRLMSRVSPALGRRSRRPRRELPLCYRVQPGGNACDLCVLRMIGYIAGWGTTIKSPEGSSVATLRRPWGSNALLRTSAEAGKPNYCDPRIGGCSSRQAPRCRVWRGVSVAFS